MSDSRKNDAIRLRKMGLLLSEIARELGIAKSTAYEWTKSVSMSVREQGLVDDRLLEFQRKNASKLTEIRKAIYVERMADINQRAQKIVEQASGSIADMQLHCALLFWCEGGKQVNDGFQFINSDPYMIKTFLRLLRNAFSINEAKLRALVHLHEYHDISKQLAYWSEITNIPISQFHKPYLKPHTGKNTREGYPGCLSLRYHDSSLGKLLKMVYSTYGSF